jgi:hypothetical protein
MPHSVFRVVTCPTRALAVFRRSKATIQRVFDEISNGGNAMRHTALKALVLSGLIVAAAASAFAQKKYDTGASDTEIMIGNIVPYSGPASAYGVEAVGGVPQNLQQSPHLW